MKTIAIVNQKGGVGKTTTALAIAAGLRSKGFKVLSIDLDAQGNMSYSHGVINPAISSMEVLSGSNTATEAIQETGSGALIPASTGLATADLTLTATGKEYRLKEALAKIADRFDYAVIDTPPALGILSVNALTAADLAIIPSRVDIFSLQGVGALTQTIGAVKQYTNPGLKVAGILFTRHSSRANIDKDLKDMIEKTAKEIGTKTFSTVIRECAALREAQAYQKDLFAHAPASNAAVDYMALIDELIGA